MLEVDRYGFDKKCARTSYVELDFLHLVRSVGPIVHSNVSGREMSMALFFMLGCYRYRFHKKRAQTRYTKFVFLHPVGYVVHIVHSGASWT
jgi:hypothetical protein